MPSGIGSWRRHENSGRFVGSRLREERKGQSVDLLVESPDHESRIAHRTTSGKASSFDLLLWYPER